LSVPVQVIDWKRLGSEMTWNVLIVYQTPLTHSSMQLPIFVWHVSIGMLYRDINCTRQLSCAVDMFAALQN